MAAVVQFCIRVFFLWILACITLSNSQANVGVTVDTTNIINCVDYNYLGFTLDAFGFGTTPPWRGLNFSSPKIHTLMTALSPAILRVGGTSADRLFYNKPSNVMKRMKLLPTANVMNATDVITLVELVRSTGNRLIFGLNIQIRFGLQWDPSNAIELLDFCSEMSYCDSIDWELGNEPEDYKRLNMTTLTPEQIGNDFLILKLLLSKYASCRNSAIVGPDLGSTTSLLEGKILSGFVDFAGSVLKAVTIHHYYFNGILATYEDYLDVSYFSNLFNVLNVTKHLLSRTRYPNISLWLGETSGAARSGTRNVSDRFVSGFLWMEKLGLAATMGVKVTLRQDFYGGYYGLIDKEMNPNPDYWLTWLHKKLVGQSVFAVNLTTTLTSPTTRVYAHCTKTNGSSYTAGAVTVFALNVDQNVSSVLTFSGPLANQQIDVYLLEADGTVLSMWVKLNGIRLIMPSDYSMPTITPVSLTPGSSVTLPPVTMGFFVFPFAKIPLCPCDLSSTLCFSSSLSLSSTIHFSVVILLQILGIFQL